MAPQPTPQPASQPVAQLNSPLMPAVELVYLPLYQRLRTSLLCWALLLHMVIPLQVLPLAKVKRLIKQSSNVKAISGEGSFAIARATVRSAFW